MKGNRLSRCIIIPLLFCSGADLRAQDIEPVINPHLNNYRIREVYEDTANFRTGNIFSVRQYELLKKGETALPGKTFNGKQFTQKAYTEYLPDGRKRYKEYVYDHIDRVENYHYDKQFKNLLLAERSEDHKVFYYSWLFYDDNSNLSEDISYRIYGVKVFDYESYTRYKVKQADNKTRVDIIHYGDDTLADPTETYVFAYPYLYRSSPLYQSKKQEFKLIGDSYKLMTIQGFVFEDRLVKYTYDDKGFVTSEIWYKPAGTLENKTEYAYSADYRERVEQRYHMRGTEKSTKTTRRYDDKDNLVFEQSVEYTGNPLSIQHFGYVYDEQGNWTEKKEYRQACDKGVYGPKELVGHTIREIHYYQPGQNPRALDLPDFPKRAEHVKKEIPRLAEGKQRGVDQFNAAVAAGDFEEIIKQQTAPNLEDFTPKYWTLVATALGDLDNVPGDEAAVVYKTPVTGESGYKHCLAVFKKANGRWQLWHQTTAPLLEDQAGGMMGNPFESIKIERRAVVIAHFGGSRDKWSYTHRYRFQNNNWYLIGANINYGAPCDYWQSLDYNLSTGDAVIKNEKETCEEDMERVTTSWTEKLKLKKPLPLMDTFVPGETRIRVVKKDFDIYY